MTSHENADRMHPLQPKDNISKHHDELLMYYNLFFNKRRTAYLAYPNGGNQGYDVGTSLVVVEFDASGEACFRPLEPDQVHLSSMS